MSAPEDTDVPVSEVPVSTEAVATTEVAAEPALTASSAEAAAVVEEVAEEPAPIVPPVVVPAGMPALQLQDPAVVYLVGAGRPARHALAVQLADGLARAEVPVASVRLMVQREDEDDAAFIEEASAKVAACTTGVSVIVARNGASRAFDQIADVTLRCHPRRPGHDGWTWEIERNRFGQTGDGGVIAG